MQASAQASQASPTVTPLRGATACDWHDDKGYGHGLRPLNSVAQCGLDRRRGPGQRGRGHWRSSERRRLRSGRSPSTTTLPGGLIRVVSRPRRQMRRHSRSAPVLAASPPALRRRSHGRRPTRLPAAEPVSLFNSSSNGIQWGATAEAGTASLTANGDRVMSFAACGGKLYASIYDAIVVRTDGASPSWQIFYRYSGPALSSAEQRISRPDLRAQSQWLGLDAHCGAGGQLG